MTGRTKAEVFVMGRSPQEVRDEVLRWMASWNLKLVAEAPGWLKCQLGHVLGFSAPRVFEVSISTVQGGTGVLTQGYIMGMGVSEMSFDPNEFVGMWPRREGWKIINDLWARLGAMSARPLATPGPPAPPCLRCGGPLAFIAQHRRWYCPRCGIYPG